MAFRPITKEQIYVIQTRTPGRNVNVPIHESLLTDFHQRQTTQEVSHMPLQYHKPPRAHSPVARIVHPPGACSMPVPTASGMQSSFAHNAQTTIPRSIQQHVSHRMQTPHRTPSPISRPIQPPVIQSMQSPFSHSLQSSLTHGVQRQNARKLTSMRTEGNELYDHMYALPLAPPPALHYPYEVLKQQNVMDNILYRSKFEEPYVDVEEEGETELDEDFEEAVLEENESEIDVMEYVQNALQRGRMVIAKDYFQSKALRDVSFCDPYVAERLCMKMPPRNLKRPQSIAPEFGCRPGSPPVYTRQQMSEPIRSRAKQNKPKITTRCYESDGRLYGRSHSPELKYYDAKEPKEYHLFEHPQRENRLEELQQQREEEVFDEGEKELVHGNEEVGPTQCPLSPRDCLNLATKEDDYLNKLRSSFREKAHDVQRLIEAKKAELEMHKARCKSPVATFPKGLNSEKQ